MENVLDESLIIDINTDKKTAVKNEPGWVNLIDGVDTVERCTRPS